MTQRDYIVRQIEAFTEALARALALRDDRQYEAAAVMLEGLSERYLGLGLATLRALSPESLAVLWSMGGELDAERSEIAAEILHVARTLDDRGGSAADDG
jgi:hypothetical protein